MIVEIMDRISPNNSRGVIIIIIFFFFRTKMRWLFEGGNIAHWKSCPIFYFIIPLNQKMITSNKLNMGLSKCSKFGSLINLSVNILGVKAWIVTDPVLLDQNPIQLYREGIEETEDGGGVGDFLRKATIFNISV